MGNDSEIYGVWVGDQDPGEFLAEVSTHPQMVEYLEDVWADTFRHDNYDVDALAGEVLAAARRLAGWD
jgi:hypothetical protein